MAAEGTAAITPTPDDEETAAILAALAAYLAEQRRPPTPPARTASRWALAGRLASHGFAPRRLPRTQLGWRNVGRKSVGSRQ